jgi:hypothetical protein
MREGEAKGTDVGLPEENAEMRNDLGTVEPQAEQTGVRAATWKRIEALAAEYRKMNPGVTPEETWKRIEALAAEYRRKNPGVDPEETWKRIEALAAARR